MVDAARAEFDSSVTEERLRGLVGNLRLKVLQTSLPVDSHIWILLNECFFAARPDVSLRVYGHYSTECDLSFARRMTNVRRLAVDCLMRATNVEAIAEIPRLESLSLGVFEAEEFHVLELIPPTLTELSLGATKSRKPSLRPLSRLRGLRVLYLEGQSNGIEVLNDLRELEALTLRSITTPDLSYLTSLANLWSLEVKLGGIRSFVGIEGKESIKYLELWQIRGLRSVDIIAGLPGLQNLFLQSLRRIESLPSLANSSLRRVVLENLKGMLDFGSLESAPTLEEFALLEGLRQTPEQLLPVLRNPAVRRVAAFFGSDRKNRGFSRLCTEYGKKHWNPSVPFEYR